MAYGSPNGNNNPSLEHKARMPAVLNLEIKMNVLIKIANITMVIRDLMVLLFLLSIVVMLGRILIRMIIQ